MAKQQGKPTYQIGTIKDLVKAGKVVITKSAQQSALDDFGFGDFEIKTTVLRLSVHHFYKTMPAK